MECVEGEESVGGTLDEAQDSETDTEGLCRIYYSYKLLYPTDIVLYKEIIYIQRVIQLKMAR